MSATKRHFETLTTEHGYYAACDSSERQAYRFAVLDCAERVLKHAIASTDDTERETLYEMVDMMHTLCDELRAVADWQPAE